MRGKPLISHLGKHAKRITPADAGKTVCTTTHTPVQWDHPRRCGENKTTLRQCSYRLRITPAGAGKTRENRRNPAQAAGSPPQVRGKRVGLFSCSVFNQDHPRRCGENRLAGLSDDANKGSPPQVRGKPFFPCGLLTFFRITPAGAGKTFMSVTKSRRKPDHPRRCGENKRLTG